MYREPSQCRIPGVSSKTFASERRGEGMRHGFLCPAQELNSVPSNRGLTLKEVLRLEIRQISLRAVCRIERKGNILG